MSNDPYRPRSLKEFGSSLYSEDRKSDNYLEPKYRPYAAVIRQIEWYQEIRYERHGRMKMSQHLYTDLVLQGILGISTTFLVGIILYTYFLL